MKKKKSIKGKTQTKLPGSFNCGLQTKRIAILLFIAARRHPMGTKTLEEANESVRQI